MQITEKGQSWRLHITSKARNFNFKFIFRFNSSSFTPTSSTISSSRLFILLKFRKFILRIYSNPTASNPNNGRGSFIKARVMKIVHKFRALLPKKGLRIATKPESHLLYPKVQQMKLQVPIRIGLWVMGFVASLAQSVIMNAQKGTMMMLASSWGFIAFLLSKKLKTVRLIVKLVMLPLVVAIIACYLFLNFDNNYWDCIAWSWSSVNTIASL